MTDGGDGPTLDHFFQRATARPAVQLRGRVKDIRGLVIRASLPEATIGMITDVARAARPAVLARVIGIQDGDAILVPYGDLTGVGPDSVVVTRSGDLGVTCGPALLGRVLDGMGNAMDEGPPITGVYRTCHAAPPHPLERKRVATPFYTGVRAIDAMTTLGEGQRVGLFAGSGVGKSTLLGQIAQGSDADTTVICLVGERGREVRAFLEDSLGCGLQRAVVVCATSDAPALVRLQAGQVATTIAEYFRDEGQRVLLLVDSVTRLARAQREVALAAGEPPVHRGFPPSVFALLPRLLERAGCAAQGSITAIYSVLLSGDDLHGPVADEIRGTLDGHIVLSRRLAERGHWPAVDTLASLSRLMPHVTDTEHRRRATQLRKIMAAYEDHRDLIALGAYQRGTEPMVDMAMDTWPDLERFLQQAAAEPSTLATTLARLRILVP